VRSIDVEGTTENFEDTFLSKSGGSFGSAKQDTQLLVGRAKQDPGSEKQDTHLPIAQLTVSARRWVTWIAFMASHRTHLLWGNMHRLLIIRD
jgi:hypothetical protein